MSRLVEAKVILCKDCKWSEGNGPLECVHPKTYTIDLTTGDKYQDYRYCSTQRQVCWLSAILFNFCGKSGRWFEPKEAV